MSEIKQAAAGTEDAKQFPGSKTLVEFCPYRALHVLSDTHICKDGRGHI